jgi:WXG100 family type VII secretion target
MSGLPLRLRPEDLHAAASGLGQLGGSTSQSQETLSRSWARLDAGWDTYAEEEANALFHSAMQEMSRMAAMFSQMADALHQNSALIEEADRENASRFSVEGAATGTGGGGRPPGLAMMAPPAMINLTAGMPAWNGQVYGSPTRQGGEDPPWKDFFERIRNWLSGKGWKTDEELAAEAGATPPVEETPPTEENPPTEETPPTEENPPAEETPQTPALTGFVAGGTVYLSASGVNVRPNPTTADDPNIAEDNPLGQLNVNTPVTLVTGDPVPDNNPDDPHTWYEVETPLGHGWIASEFLTASLIGGGFIMGASTAGGNLWDTESPHYGIDIHATGDDHNIYSPGPGTVIAADDCEACQTTTDSEGNKIPNPSGNAEGHTDDAAYNYGLGATVVVEYTYENLTEEQRTALQDAGITIGPGQSLYLLYGHLNPTDVPDSNTDLTAGDQVAIIGNSGNSYGDHAHVEAVVNDSGLRPGDDENIALFFWDTVAEREQAGEQGLRFDPSPIFDLGE